MTNAVICHFIRGYLVPLLPYFKPSLPIMMQVFPIMLITRLNIVKLQKNNVICTRNSLSEFMHEIHYSMIIKSLNLSAFGIKNSYA